MSDLVTWLRARLDEDERVAQAATSQGVWSRDSVEDGRVWAEGLKVVAIRCYPEDADHIAHHHPQRVLAEVEAKRRIIGEYERYAAERRRAMGGWESHSEISPVLAALAAVYADRDGYREEWRWRPSA